MLFLLLFLLPMTIHRKFLLLFLLPQYQQTVRKPPKVLEMQYFCEQPKTYLDKQHLIECILGCHNRVQRWRTMTGRTVAHQPWHRRLLHHSFECRVRQAKPQMAVRHLVCGLLAPQGRQSK